MGNWGQLVCVFPVSLCLHTGCFHPSLFSVTAFCNEELEDSAQKGVKEYMQYKKIWIGG